MVDEQRTETEEIVLQRHFMLIREKSRTETMGFQRKPASSKESSTVSDHKPKSGPIRSVQAKRNAKGQRLHDQNSPRLEGLQNFRRACYNIDVI